MRTAAQDCRLLLRVAARTAWTSILSLGAKGSGFCWIDQRERRVRRASDAGINGSHQMRETRHRRQSRQSGHALALLVSDVTRPAFLCHKISAPRSVPPLIAEILWHKKEIGRAHV